MSLKINAFMSTAIVLGLTGFLSLPVLAQADVAGAEAESAEVESVLDSSEIRLAPGYVAGQETLYEFWTSRQTTMSIEPPPGMNIPDDQRQFTSGIRTEGTARWAVESVNEDGSAVCVMTYERVKLIRVANDGSELVQDSDEGSGDDPILQELVSAVVDVPVTYSLNADGTVESVEGFEAIADKLSEQAKGIAPDDKDFEETASRFAYLIAAPALAEVGATWSFDLSEEHEMGEMNTELVYELTGLETIESIKLATVVGVGRMTLDVELPDTPPNAPPVDVDQLKGEVTTEVIYDLTRGEAVGRNQVEHTIIEINIPIPTPQGLSTFRRTMDQKVQSQLLRIEEIQPAADETAVEE